MVDTVLKICTLVYGIRFEWVLADFMAFYRIVFDKVNIFVLFFDLFLIRNTDIQVGPGPEKNRFRFML